jgi:Acetyltransferase (GNAT) domain
VIDPTTLWPPYAGPAWGRVVAEVFGGDFDVHAIELADGDGRSLRGYLAPLMRGGQLAAGGFVSGHIGYGGVYEVDTGQPAPVHMQLRVLARLSADLAVPCLRLVSPPVSEAEARAPALAAWRSETAIKTLALDGLFAGYDGAVRTALRKAHLTPGLRTGVLEAADRAAAIALIHHTQARVGAGYLSPAALVERMIASDDANFLAAGAWIGAHLISVGLFVVNHRQAAYYLNGWSSDALRCGPNYPMLDTAMRLLALRGVESVDFGYSHRGSLADSKRRWGAKPRAFLRIPHPNQS